LSSHGQGNATLPHGPCDRSRALAHGDRARHAGAWFAFVSSWSHFDRHAAITKMRIAAGECLVAENASLDEADLAIVEGRVKNGNAPHSDLRNSVLLLRR
jgi:hypothetical protein